ncbi:transcriptional regulator NrdR [Candidatus Haliotispira prima]|uniref:Transcriptional repressor NrdR n=1 Tax=Candidatus Haliotispira prima TaxID=3034016 RepID=A0ABY8MIU3_9SPIO|nr:transcriptional regulator NrdR [Candidatus Haliotispira prima]
MKCPRCSCLDNRVLDSRQSSRGTSTRRRRECSSCSFRFTSHEEIDAITMRVRKQNGQIQDFNWQKLRNGVSRSIEKRQISMNKVEDFFNKLEANFTERSYQKKELTSDEIGETVLRHLLEFDIIAYVRFAAVYKKFNSLEEFVQIITELQAS